jgi:hypothetical protein
MSMDATTAAGFRGFETNEETVGSLVDDPPKVRVTVHITEHGGGGGVVSFNASRHPGMVCMGGDQLEMGYIRVEQAESVRGETGNLRSEMNFFLNDGSGADDAAMVRAFAFECDRITKMHPGFRASLRAWLLEPDEGIPSPPAARPPFKMLSENGRFELIVQDDGNFVIYDYARPDGHRAIWSAFGGRIP